MIALIDTFNNREISRHRTLRAAVAAQRKHLAAVKKANGAGSYVTYGFRENGQPVGGDEITAVRMELDNA